MEARYETFTVLIARISRSIRRLKGEEMARWGLKGPHVSCLYYLALSGPMTAAELCERCEEDKAAVSRSVDYLERNGFLVCRDSGGRRYKNPLELTDRGRAVCEAMAARIGRIVEAVSSGVDEGDRQGMYRALTQIGQGLEALYSEEKKETEAQAGPGFVSAEQGGTN